MKLESILPLAEIALVASLLYGGFQGCNHVLNTVNYVKNQKEANKIMEQYDRQIPRFDWTNGKDVVREGKRLNAQYQGKLNAISDKLIGLDKSL